MRLKAAVDFRKGDFVAVRGFWFWKRFVVPHETRRKLGNCRMRILQVYGTAKHDVRRGELLESAPMRLDDWVLMPTGGAW